MRVSKSTFGGVVSFVCLALLASAAMADPIVVKPFGNTAEYNGGQQIFQITLTNSKGCSASLINYGAILTSLYEPDKNGELGDVVLGFNNVREYEETGAFLGCIVGRYANRIAHGTFTLDGSRYAVTVNSGVNSLHGGFKGFAKRIWDFDAGMAADGPTCRFTLLDPDGTEGFPGDVKVTVLYTLMNDNTLKIQYYATTDKPTPINLSHHSYFNLTDGGKSDVLSYVCRLTADNYLPVDATLAPTGEIASVAGTPFDFTKAKLIGRDIHLLSGTTPGYDNTMVLNHAPDELSKAADVYDPQSGRLLECWTTEPGVHFYTASNLPAVTGKNGIVYGSYKAFCLETQHFPDSPNHPNFPSTILRPGDTYRQITEFRFSIPKEPLTPEQ
jgi:aldose 1-epimerase